MKKFIHLGMPKSLSSALQGSYFSFHESIHFLGVGVGSPIDYVNDSINRIFDSLILYSNSDFYYLNKNAAINAFEKEVELAKDTKKKWVGLSSEWLGFNLTPDMVDPDLKIKRLSEIVGTDALIIFITRNNFSFLKSLWAQLVKEGLPKSFSDYCQYLWEFQDRSCLYEMLYDHQYLRLVKTFGEDNVEFIPLELYRQDDGRLTKNNNKIDLIQELCRILDIEYPSNFDLPVVNPSSSKKELFHKLELNKMYPHDFGNLIFDPPNIHRSRKQLELLGGLENQDLFKYVKMKRLLLEQAKQAAMVSDSEVSFSLSEKLSSNLNNLFIESNKNFEKISGIKLPQQYFDRSL